VHGTAAAASAAAAAATAPACGDEGMDGVCEAALNAFCSQEGLGGEEGEGVCGGEGGDEDGGEDGGGLGGGEGGGRGEGGEDGGEAGGGEEGEEEWYSALSQQMFPTWRLGWGEGQKGEVETGTKMLYESYEAKENETPKSIAKLLRVDYKDLIKVGGRARTHVCV
jgi:hypothetical protein